jgi:hypothetical protein
VWISHDPLAPGEEKKKIKINKKKTDKHKAKEKHRQRTTTVQKKIQVYAWTNKFSVKETAVNNIWWCRQRGIKFSYLIHNEIV